MDAKEITFIEDQIGYSFKNKDLLQQAFVRRSYSNEEGGECNEQLEFIGDKVLDFICVKLLAERFGCMASELEGFNADEDFDEYVCEYREKQLTELKKRLVEKINLSKCIDELGLSEYLIMGKSDIKQNVQEEPSVKEDLFEAILGAVALDSKWNMASLEDTVIIMLQPEQILATEDEDHNYVGFVQNWCESDYGGIPLYHYEEGTYTSTWYIPFDGISQRVDTFNSQEYLQFKYRCFMKIRDDLPIFRGFGKSKAEARMNVCELCYKWLIEKDMLRTIRDEIENPNRDDAISQLEILARRGYFSIPTYSSCEQHDKNGNPIWTVECHIEEIEQSFGARSSSKKEAKKDAAYEMLRHVLEGNSYD